MRYAAGMATCPICGAAVPPRAQAAGRDARKASSFPFCSARCRQIDLGKWLLEEYRVPAEETPTDDVQGGAQPLPHSEDA